MLSPIVVRKPLERDAQIKNSTRTTMMNACNNIKIKISGLQRRCFWQEGKDNNKRRRRRKLFTFDRIFYTNFFSSWTILLLFLLLVTLPTTTHSWRDRLRRRDCFGSVRHVHLAVGKDPSTSMTISFSSIDVPSSSEDATVVENNNNSSTITTMINNNNSSSVRETTTNDKTTKTAAVHGAILIGTKKHRMDRLVIETEEPIYYTSVQPEHLEHYYTSPYQHHITITDLKPQTKYYYQIIIRETMEELVQYQKTLLLKNMNATTSKKEDISSLFATELLKKEREKEKELSGEFEESGRRRQRRTLLEEQFLRQSRHRRRLAPPPYDSTQCACPDPNKVRHFCTMSRPGHGNPIIAVIGDIGQFPHSEETIDHLLHYHTNHSSIDSIILTGDLAYPELDHRRWDTFMDFWDDYPLIEYVPMHITPGNHDIDKPRNGTNIFTAYEYRFRMPRIRKPQLGIYDAETNIELNMDRPPYPLNYEYGNAYYAFKYGKTHQIYINSYSNLDPGSLQYEWLVQELQSVDRKQTPWLLVTYHVPIYNTFEVHQHDVQMYKTREHIEPLLVQYKVNIVFNGHIHAYQRTKPVAFGNVTSTGPIHIVMGAGGRNADASFLNEVPEDWVVVRDGTIYGYGILEILNKTHAQWFWIHTGKKGDYNKVHGHPNITLPPGGVDHSYIVNQFYL